MPPCPTSPLGGSASSSSRIRSAQNSAPGRGAFEANLVAAHPTPHADRGDIGSHQRLVVGIVVVTFGNDLGRDLIAALLVGPEMGESRVAAQHFAVMHAHDAAAERIVHAVFNLVESVQHRKNPNSLAIAAPHSTAWRTSTTGFNAA